jgi:gas vesicle protein
MKGGDDMKTGEEGNGVGRVLISFFIGGMVGAGTALLLAPRSGQETRQKIKGIADEAIEKAESLAVQVKSTAQTVVEKGKKLVEEKKSIIETAVEAGKEAYQKEKERVSGPQARAQ